MRSLLLAAALGASVSLGSGAALAFTYENQGTTQPSAAAPQAPQMGFGDMDPKAVLPPIGESIPGQSFDFGPGAFNNGLASQPTRADSVGPSWLHPPR